jgi:purine-binding chemotaxis protein CheW
MTYNLVNTNQRQVSNVGVEKKEFLTMDVAGQLFGISVYSVRDVLAPQKITNIPLSPKEVIGSLNLRGRIVTAIDLRCTT